MSLRLAGGKSHHTHCCSQWEERKQGHQPAPAYLGLCPCATGHLTLSCQASSKKNQLHSEQSPTQARGVGMWGPLSVGSSAMSPTSCFQLPNPENSQALNCHLHCGRNVGTVSSWASPSSHPSLLQRAVIEVEEPV